jgi:tetratricopeptide (TPR) repeat protein
MGFLSKLFGRRGEAIVVDGEVVTLRNAEVARSIVRPSAANFALEEMKEPCGGCGGQLREAFITTGGELGDPKVWRDHPVAVDGWACASCGVFRYPRKIDPARIHELTEEGAARGRAGDYTAAELRFCRIVWNWPGYFLGHLNYAEATRTRLHSEKIDDPLVERRLKQRMIEQYEAALEAYVATPTPRLIAGVVRASFATIEDAIANRAIDRASRLLHQVLQLADLPEEERQELEQLRVYISEGRWRFQEAAKVLMPYLHLQGRPNAPIPSGEVRKALVTAMDSLTELVADAPSFAEPAWLLAKAKECLGDKQGALATFRAGHAQHPSFEPIAKDFSLILLEKDEIEEARAVNRAITSSCPSAESYCNLAVTELLSGDLDAAEAALAKSLALDPNDKIANAVQSRLAKYRAGAKLPRTIRELERG